MNKPILQILGPEPRLASADGGDLLLPPGKPFAALCLIALEPGGLTRDDLITFLWPQAAPDRARASVRQALHVLRKAAEPGLVTEAAGTLSVADGALELDVRTVERAMEAEDLLTAHGLWKGGPFAHFSLVDAPAFNEWADRVRGRHERRLADALMDRAVTARHAGEQEDALAWAQRTLDVRPYDEGGHAFTAETLLDLGMLTEAEKALQKARTVVDEPTPGVLEALQDRLRAVRRSRMTLEAQEPSLLTLEFVGRTAEIAGLRTHWRSVLTGRPRSVALLGEAGIGKSRLAEEFIRNTVDPDVTVVRCKALDNERSLHFGLVAELAKELSSRPGAAGIANASLATLAQLVPSLGSGNNGTSGIPSEVAIADALLDMVEAVSHESPTILLLEDLQWADPHSRTLLLRLARSVRGVQTLTLVTCRSGDADLGAVRALRGEAEAGRFETMDLAPLSPNDVREAVALSLDVRPETETERIADRLAAVSRGNPLFLSELILRLRAEGMIERDGKAWVLDGARAVNDSLPLPSTVHEILEQRLHDAGPDEVPILRAVADSDCFVATSALSAKLGISHERLLDLLDPLLSRGILTRDEEDAIGYAHDSLRDTAKRLLPPLRTGRRRRVFLWHAAAISAAIVTTALLAWSRFRDTSPPGWAADAETWGRLVVSSQQRTLWEVVWPASPGDSLRFRPLLSAPGTSDAHVLGGRPLDDGTVEWFAATLSPTEPPDLISIHGDRRRRVLSSRGDDGDFVLSPDARRAISSQEVLGAPEYRKQTVLINLETGHVDTLLVGGQQAPWQGDWSPDGLRFAFPVEGPPDTIVVVGPSGGIVERWVPTPEGRVGDIAWCADDALVVEYGAGAGKRLAVLDGRGTKLRNVTTPGFVTGGTTCVGGSRPAVAYFGATGDHLVLTVSDLEADSVLSQGTLPEVPTGMFWLLRAPPPLDPSIRINGPDTLRVGWGGRVALTAGTKPGSPGNLPKASWASSFPGVASVDTAGGVTAIRPGIAWISVRQGWSRDSVAVVVDPGRPRALLLSETFDEGWMDRWEPFGFPTPVAVAEDGARTLFLNGDGTHIDGVVSKADHDASRGMTLDLEFQVSVLDRRDRQRMMACLTDARVLQPSGTMVHEQGFCFAYPGGELARFDAGEGMVVFRGLGINGTVPVGPAPPIGRWVALRVEIQPDGKASAYLDGSPLPVPDLRVQTSGRRFRIVLTGASVETEVMVRNVNWWDGVGGE